MLRSNNNSKLFREYWRLCYIRKQGSGSSSSSQRIDECDLHRQEKARLLSFFAVIRFPPTWRRRLAKRFTWESKQCEELSASLDRLLATPIYVAC